MRARSAASRRCTTPGIPMTQCAGPTRDSCTPSSRVGCSRAVEMTRSAGSSSSALTATRGCAARSRLVRGPAGTGTSTRGSPTRTSRTPWPCTRVVAAASASLVCSPSILTGGHGTGGASGTSCARWTSGPSSTQASPSLPPCSTPMTPLVRASTGSRCTRVRTLTTRTTESNFTTRWGRRVACSRSLPPSAGSCGTLRRA